MNTISKIFFWILVVGLGLINPLISIALVVLYYLPKIIRDICDGEKDAESFRMDHYSDDILKEMK
jgi:hypothetical protein